MKKTLALVSLLVLAMACAAPPTNDVATTNRNANAGAITLSGNDRGGCNCQGKGNLGHHQS